MASDRDKYFGFVYRDITLRHLDERQLDEIISNIYKHRLVVIKNQDLTVAEYVSFAERLGRPEPYLQENYHHPDYPVIFVSSNVVHNGRKMGVARTGGYWHTDTSFQPNPMPFTMLYPQIIPEINKRSTLFIDMGAVYETLPAELKRAIEGRWALHSGRWRYKVREQDVGADISELLNMIDSQAPPARHPVVFSHPATDEPILYVNSGFTVALEGVPRTHSDEILHAIFEFVEREEHVKSVCWEYGDIIIWDNRFLIHKSGRAAPTGPVGSEHALAEEKTMVFRICMRDAFPFYPGIAQGRVS